MLPNRLRDGPEKRRPIVGAIHIKISLYGKMVPGKPVGKTPRPANGGPHSPDRAAPASLERPRDFAYA